MFKHRHGRTMIRRARPSGAVLAAAGAVALALGAASPAQAVEPSVMSLSLINADSDLPISSQTPLRSGASLNFATLGTRNLNVRAFVAATAKSVVFDLDGSRFRVEGSAPYALAGNSGSNYIAWTPSVGSHTLRVTAYTGTNGTGSAGTPTTVTFSVTTDGTTTPPPSGTKPRWPSRWTQQGNAPQPRFESAGTQVNGKVYAFGGFSSSNFTVNRSYVSYDFGTGRWTSLGTLPAGVAETHVGLAHDSRYIYIAGGFAGDLHASQPPGQAISNRVWRYDTQTNGWTQIATLPQARGAGGLALIGRKLHYVGGNPSDRVTNVGTHYVYDLDSKAWTTAAPMPNPKDHFSTVELGGKIYVLGGEHGHDKLHQQQGDVHVYDPATNAWTKLANLPMAKSHIEGGTFVLDGKIVMAGGQTDNFTPTAQVVSYDPASNVWSTLTSLPATRQGAIVQPYGGKVVVTLGALRTDQPQATTWTGALP